MSARTPSERLFGLADRMQFAGHSTLIMRDELREIAGELRLREHFDAGVADARLGKVRWPPHYLPPSDPRTLAYIEGYEQADHDLRWKGE